jgi:hypothetical protein
MKAFDDRRHLDEYSSGYDHYVSFAWSSTDNFCAKAGNIILWCHTGCHLHKAAGQSEVKWPHGILSSPRQEILNGGQHDTLLHSLFEGTCSLYSSCGFIGFA